MPTEQDGARDVIAFIVRRLECLKCGTPYNPDDVHVVAHHGIEWELAATCPACQAERLIVAYDSPPYVKLPLSASPITPDEVAQWAAFLASFTGTMHDLLAHD